MNIITIKKPQEWETMRLYGYGDLHEGDGLLNKSEVKAYENQIKADEQCGVIANGDLINNATRASVSDPYEQTMSPDKQIDAVSERLYQIKDKLIAITDGNHEDRTYKASGIKIMRRVARELGVEHLYSDPAFLIFLSFGKYKSKNDRQMTYAIYGSHGSGGGRSVGAKANKLEKEKLIIDADIYIQSHTHQPISFREPYFRIDYQNKCVTEVDKLFVNFSAWLDYGGYGEKFGYPPASKMPPIIQLESKVKRARCLI